MYTFVCVYVYETVSEEERERMRERKNFMSPWKFDIIRLD